MKKSNFNILDRIIIIVSLIIATIFIIDCMNNNKFFDNTDNSVESLIRRRAIDYLEYDVDFLKKLYNEKYYDFIKVETLVNAGLITKSEVKNISLNDLIKIKINLKTGIIESEYPIQPVDNINFYSLDENVKIGTVYNCVDSLGSYKMSFLNSDGFYVNVRDYDNKLDLNILLNYKLRCEYDERLPLSDEKLTFSNDLNIISYDSVIPNQIGTYVIKYSYVDDNGKEHKLVKNLRVY